MAGPTQVARGNVSEEMVMTAIWTPPASLSAQTSQLAVYTLQGVQVNDLIELNQQSHITGILVGNVWVSAANQVSVQWVNSTSGTISNAPTATFILCVTRYENSGLTPPTSIVG